MDFEKYLTKNSGFYAASTARSKSQEINEKKISAEFKITIESQEFKDMASQIMAAVEKGESSVSIPPSPDEKIKEYTSQHKLVPVELTSFSKEQKNAIKALKKLGYTVVYDKTYGYFEGMHPTDEPIGVELAKVFWG